MIILMIRASDSSPPARGRRLRNWVIIWIRLIHPLLRGADSLCLGLYACPCDSSPPARGRHSFVSGSLNSNRFIPSCEGQTSFSPFTVCSAAIHPLLRGADSVHARERARKGDSSPPARGRPNANKHFLYCYRFIPSCEGQTLSVYAAFSRLKHLVVQFAQILLSTRHTSFPLHIICRKNIFFAIFPNIFFIFFQSSFHIHHPRQFLCLHLHSYLLCIFVHL